MVVPQVARVAISYANPTHAHCAYVATIWPLFDKKFIMCLKDSALLYYTTTMISVQGNRSFERVEYNKFRYCGSRVGRKAWIKKLDNILDKEKVKEEGTLAAGNHYHYYHADMES